ncbi:ninjurin-1 isoform X2 [Petromyzon marinus]|uniref:Ninjurin-1 isoform X2 n=1 Tax=Petromyzon marinus TaxID=7757 RepID=A0AAJ7XBA1_PETMA|nr:ninjurin-1 isoform X2 [Petromyzon marinus]XP_032828392.1 ninjurin-1 isoform X2 [Petromyzon marinus]XP_032828394.1 ninjurin-1 isoform X2 [Petromyzon marinus]XP_032828395.1 ninjurin-1 isoform X2 [Petromyzon marinus]XP_032828396.1 ninjurin-1 isoform X2 [Petromyzon marinus]XP_032828397.1 ninjurin-1 isoform X2 [Petromyzon marinus]XP_032828398.1 ninjurin-1 isoform X2 [Petromyzon marinus]XP_032828399.1 ninjurin-1 isoform X2 [Petromyzon marinus]
MELTVPEEDRLQPTPEALPANGGRVFGRRQLDLNHYATKKSAAESMLDVALLMANASQLKAVMEHGTASNFYAVLIALLSVSIIFQIVVGVLLIFIGGKRLSVPLKYDLNDAGKHRKLDLLNNIATGLIFIIVVVNVFITAFGVQKNGSPVSAAQEAPQ